MHQRGKGTLAQKQLSKWLPMCITSFYEMLDMDMFLLTTFDSVISVTSH